MRKLAMVLICSLFVVHPAMADDRTDLKNLVEEKVVIILETLRRKDIDKMAKRGIILDTAVPFIDFDRMAKLSLGKKYWKRMNKAQRKTFSKRFVQRLKDSVLEKLELYTDEEMLVERAEKVKKRIYIFNYILTEEDKKEMIFKFYKSKKGWKAYDVEIMGVSFVQTYRSQFVGVLKEGSIDDLLEKLKTADAFSVPDGKK
ncbi:MAG: ABC transporter substrate-binding protein [Proteobacteria bacterium]|nr:ABC transporter substrate-binding protein [Pseudomonadota bacterium]